MIDVKQAVRMAIFHLNELYSVTELAGAMLEEVELSSDGKH